MMEHPPRLPGLGWIRTSIPGTPRQDCQMNPRYEQRSARGPGGQRVAKALIPVAFAAIRPRQARHRHNAPPAAASTSKM